MLTEPEFNKVLKIISMGRNSKPKFILFLLSAWAGMLVGDIAALKLRDVLNPNGAIVQQIELKAAQTKGD